MPEVVHPRAAGIDVGNGMHYVAVRSDRDPQPVRRFECFTADLHRLADWLQRCGVKTAAMQSTGVYWIPIYEILEERGIQVYLVSNGQLRTGSITSGERDAIYLTSANPEYNLNMSKLFRITAAFLLVAIYAIPSLAQERSVALTFDDLPIAGTADSAEARSTNISILDSLDRHHAPAIGFVIEGRVQEIGEVRGKQLLDQWVERGYELGNHTFSHTISDDLTVDQFNDGIVAGESSFAAALAKAGKIPRYFRFPESHTGDTKDKHDAIAEFLKKRGYKVAVCTIDNEDYAFNAAYLKMLSGGDDTSAARLRADYLSYTSTEIAYYSALHAQIFGREIPHVMLLHVNRLNADLIDKLLELFEQKQYRFVTLDVALSDPAYKTPDVFLARFSKYGPMWGYRWAAELHVPVNGNLESEPPAWILKYGQRQEMSSLNQAPD